METSASKDEGVCGPMISCNRNRSCESSGSQTVHDLELLGQMITSDEHLSVKVRDKKKKAAGDFFPHHSFLFHVRVSL